MNIHITVTSIRSRKQLVNIDKISKELPVLIAGPTASGKSSLALKIAESQGGVIVNADALQVFAGWRVLTARPPIEDEQRAPHALYGHVPYDGRYSTGAWLRDASPFLRANERPIIVGGTGLNFTALTEGLAEIPAIAGETRQLADELSLPELITRLDETTSTRIDLANRARVQRAFEVLHSTGKPLAVWQDDTPPALLPIADAQCFVLDAPKDWLNPRIEQRFDLMLQDGALEEAQKMSENWSPDHQSSKAIGARELIAHVRGEMSLSDAREASIIGTRQYAKRQRSWFRARMGGWQPVECG